MCKMFFVTHDVSSVANSYFELFFKNFDPIIKNNNNKNLKNLFLFMGSLLN